MNREITALHKMANPSHSGNQPSSYFPEMMQKSPWGSREHKELSEKNSVNICNKETSGANILCKSNNPMYKLEMAEVSRDYTESRQTQHRGTERQETAPRESDLNAVQMKWMGERKW
jgi:hypothetical protein